MIKVIYETSKKKIVRRVARSGYLVDIIDVAKDIWAFGFDNVSDANYHWDKVYVMIEDGDAVDIIDVTHKFREYLNDFVGVSYFNY